MIGHYYQVLRSIHAASDGIENEASVTETEARRSRTASVVLVRVGGVPIQMLRLDREARDGCAATRG